MTQVLATVLISLAIPGIALAVIFGLERRHKDSSDGLEGERSLPPEFEVSATAKALDERAAEPPNYRERAG